MRTPPWCDRGFSEPLCEPNNYAVCTQWRILKPPGSLLATDRSKAVVLVLFLLNVFGVGVSCRYLYYFVVY